MRSFFRNGLKPSLFKELRQHGFGFVDVGARGGLHPAFSDLAPLLDVVLFEPDRKEFETLRRACENGHSFRSLTYLPYALGNRVREREFFLCRSGGASSFLKPNRLLLDQFPESNRYDVLSSRQVPVRTLDVLFESESLAAGHADLVKIDAQGTALDILEGALKTLKQQALGVEIEVEFASLYKGQSLFRDIDAKLEEYGFSIFKLRRFEWDRRSVCPFGRSGGGQLIFGEALYLRRSLQIPETFHPHDARQMEACILIALLYGLEGLARELVSRPDHGIRGIEKVLRRQAFGRFMRNLKTGARAFGLNCCQARQWVRDDGCLYTGY